MQQEAVQQARVDGRVEPPLRFVSIQTSAFSGATLLARVLAMHPAIATVGEMNGLIMREDPEQYACSCGQKIKACPFWSAVGASMKAQGLPFDVAHFETAFTLPGPQLLQRLRAGSLRHQSLDQLRDYLFQLWLPERHRLERLVERNVGFVRAVLDVTGKQVFIDTSKDRLRISALRRFASIDLRVIHLVRDVRGVVASRLRRDGVVRAGDAAEQWAQLHRRLQRNFADWPAHSYLRLRYEDFCRDVDGTLERLYRFCGVEVVPARYTAPADQHIVGNAMRLAGLPQISLDERWRSLLNQEQLREIERVAGRLCLQFGYR